MPKMTPEQEAEYALDNGIGRQDLSMGAQLAYDRLRAEREAAGFMPPDALPWPPPRVPRRSSPEVRANILEMFKRTNSKYAKPFESDRLAVLSVMGGNWEEYGQIVLQMAILETLLSIEEKLTALTGQPPPVDG
jgi:hypothetical protein